MDSLKLPIAEQPHHEITSASAVLSSDDSDDDSHENYNDDISPFSKVVLDNIHPSLIKDAHDRRMSQNVTSTFTQKERLKFLRRSTFAPYSHERTEIDENEEDKLSTSSQRRLHIRKNKVVEQLRDVTSYKSDKRFLDEFDSLRELEIPDGSNTIISKIQYLLSSKGFEEDDPRLREIFSIIQMLEEKNEDIDFEMFKELIKPWYTFFRSIFQNQLVIKEFDEFKRKSEKLFNKVKALDVGGFLPNNTPHLENQNPDFFAVSIWTIDGQRINFGDSHSYVCMQHISSVVSYLIALEQLGQEEVSCYMGTEPSGKSYDSLELMKNGIPHNPLINSGILTSWSLIYQDETIDRKYEKYAKTVQKLIGGKKVDFNNEVFLSEIKRSDRNYWLLYMLQEAGTLPPNSNIKQIMQFYTQTGSIELQVQDYATLAASLANGGICPLTEERVFTDSEAVKGVLSQMLSWGLNTYSGKWSFNVGLPAKSSIWGLTILVIPNTMGVAVWSPKLDKHFTSKKAHYFLSNFVKLFGYNDFDHVYGAGINNKMMTKQALLNTQYSDSFHLLYYAQQNKLREMRQWIANGWSVNYKDYDLRTALHLAWNFGNLEIVKYLVMHGAIILIKDRFGFTPLDEAVNNGFLEIEAFLSKLYYPSFYFFLGNSLKEDGYEFSEERGGLKKSRPVFHNHKKSI